jgi:hypothetical protein
MPNRELGGMRFIVNGGSGCAEVDEAFRRGRLAVLSSCHNSHTPQLSITTHPTPAAPPQTPRQPYPHSRQDTP